MRHRWLAPLLPIVSACFRPSYDSPRCGPVGECPSGLTCSARGFCETEAFNRDGGVDAPQFVRCFGSSFMKVCFDSLADVPMAARTFDKPFEIDTDSTTLCDPKTDLKSKYCVVAGAGLTVAMGATIRGYGSKPLVLLSTTTIEIHGTIDVSSTSTTASPEDPKRKGAGALGTCTGGTPVRANSGGFGGSFQGHGGDGERKDTIDVPTAPPGIASLPTFLLGGCPGATGVAVDAPSGGAGGNGGGVVALVAGASIHLDGTINASGAGGAGGGLFQCGGGGGGSGGMIVLDAPSIVRDGSGVLFANGGGGGEGGSAEGAGQSGGVSTGPSTAAPGGDGGPDGGNGGAGSFSSNLGGLNSPGQSKAYGGGGGGGGGAGFIHSPGITGDTVIAPPSSPRA